MMGSAQESDRALALWGFYEWRFLINAASKVIPIPSKPVLIAFQEELCHLMEPPKPVREPAGCHAPRRAAFRYSGPVGSEDFRNLLAADKPGATVGRNQTTSIARCSQRPPRFSASLGFSFDPSLAKTSA